MTRTLATTLTALLLLMLPQTACAVVKLPWGVPNTERMDYVYEKEIVVAIDFNTDVTPSGDGTLVLMDKSPRNLGNNAGCSTYYDPLFETGDRCSTFVSGGGPNGSGAYQWTFDNALESFQIVNNDSLDFTANDEFSISFDIKTSDWAELLGYAIYKGSDYALQEVAGGGVKFIVDGVTGTDPETDGGEADNAWHHILLVHDGPNAKRSIYIDGVLEDSETITGGSVSHSNTYFNLGRHGNTQEFGGIVDNLRIYNYALTTVSTPATVASDNAAGDI